MKVWIVTIEYNEGSCSDAFEIYGAYDSEQKAKNAKEELDRENSDFSIEIYEKMVE